MTDLRQGVVLGQERDGWTLGTDACAERRLETAVWQLDRVAVAPQQRRDVRDRLPLLVRELWCGVDRSREDDEVVAQRGPAIGRTSAPAAAHAAIRSRSAPSVATRRAAAASASVVSSALRCARSVTQASRIASE